MKREELRKKVAMRMHKSISPYSFKHGVQMPDFYEEVASDILALMPFDEIRRLCDDIHSMCHSEYDYKRTADKILSLLPEPDEPKVLRPRPHCGGELYEAPSEIKDDEVYPPDEPKADVRKRLNDAMSDLVLEISVDMHKGKSKKMCEYTDRIMAAIGGDSNA